MADKLKIAWCDGISINQAHFEQQERYIERNIDLKTIHTTSNLYGVLSVEFSKEMLLEGKIALKNILGISKDGSIFQAPEQDLLPEPLEVSYDSLINSIIVLKIPTGLSNIADLSLQNKIPNSKYISLRSLIALRNYNDIDTDITRQLDTQSDGSNQNDFDTLALTQETRSLMLASLRMKLGILGNATLDEVEIPIAKIKNIDSNRKIELDNNFIPTCLNVAKIPIIRSFMEEMIYSIGQHKKVLSDIFKGIDQTKNTLDFSTFLSLNLLKKWHLIFSHLIKKDKLHPEFFYEKLLEFQGELAAFSVQDTFLEFIEYKHYNLSETFLPLINHLKILFSKITSPRYSMPQIINNGNGFYDLLFDNANILQESELYLAVSADINYEDLLQNFKIHSKIHTQSKIKNIVATQLKGLNINQIVNIPSSIPYLNGYIYYKLDKKDELFKDFQNENIISIYITSSIKNPDIKMWAVLND